MLKKTHDGGCYENEKTDGSRRNRGVRFYVAAPPVLKALGISAAALSLPATAQADLLSWFKGNDRPPAPAGKPLDFSKPAAWQNDLPLTPENKVTGYNNFYEFGLDKADPAANAGSLKTDPGR